MSGSAFFRDFRALALSGLPRVGLCRPLPTPVESFPELAEVLGLAELRIKRDDRTHPELGGNKVRKLEYVLGDALEKGAKTLVTAGGVGSNHALATAWYGRTLGLDTVAVLAPQPFNPSIPKYLEAHRQLGTTLVGLGLGPPALAKLRRLAGAYNVPAGGSSPVGTFGYVCAGVELAEQLNDAPVDAVVVPAGSGGTAAGMAIGLGLAGVDTRVLAVATVPWPLMTQGRLRGLTTRTAAFCRDRLGLDSRPVPVALVTGHVGKGYGHATDGGTTAADLFRLHAAPQLDPVYTAKAAAGLMHLARGPLALRRVVFVHTKDWWPGIAERAARLTA